MTTFNDKEVQLDMAFHDALTAVLALEKWLPGADTHIEISKMANRIRIMEDKAREKHFPKKKPLTYHNYIQRAMDEVVMPSLRKQFGLDGGNK